MKYDHKKIEKKWQQHWEDTGANEAKEDSAKEKFYGLIEFPYPSGAGLHVGHVRSNTAMDVICRKRRAEGYEVLYPIGWDAFGLPTENYAIKTGIHPTIVTKENTDTFRTQLKKIGFSFDWSREVNTTDPAYYKWTQWIFLQLFKKGLAYKKKMPINWCLSCKIGLANEEVVDGACERCGGDVEKRNKEQWMLKITEYADRLHSDLDEVNYLEKIKTQQRNWIGRKEGINITYNIVDSTETVICFTTRPDTNFGATFVVVGPEYPNLPNIVTQEQGEAVQVYQQEAAKKKDFERTADNKEKTGVFTGSYCINNLTGERMPIWVADYVLGDVGTGAVVGVPGHDVRDFDFAKAFNLPVKRVVVTKDGDTTDITSREQVQESEGTMVNSEFLDGLDIHEATRVVMDHLEEKGWGERVISYKLRDWVFSRQRYWGEPIPMVFCEDCDWVPVPEEQLPITLPDVEKYEPTDSGESPLATIDEWVHTTCPSCGKNAKRETDTMPNWAGSSWYFLRYCDPHNDTQLAREEALKYWTPINWYNGGMEHTTLHLLYSRFWHKFLYDIDVVPTSEPYAKRTSHGMILAEGGVKMSKSKGNVINPDDVIENVGADSLRVYEMFMGPFDQSIAWSTDGLVGARKWLERVWRLQEKLQEESKEAVERALHKTIKKVTDDIEEMKFNTAIAQMMTFTNIASEYGITKEQYAILLRLLAPFAPHITEELAASIGTEGSIHEVVWPMHDETALTEDAVTIAVQINGKVRAQLDIQTTMTEESVIAAAKEIEQVVKWLDESEPKKVIYVPKRLLNFVV